MSNFLNEHAYHAKSSLEILERKDYDEQCGS